MADALLPASRQRRPPAGRPRRRAALDHRRPGLGRRVRRAAHHSRADGHAPGPVAARGRAHPPPALAARAARQPRRVRRAGRLAGNLNQLTRLAQAGKPVVIADGLLQRLTTEVSRLRLALLGAGDNTP